MYGQICSWTFYSIPLDYLSIVMPIDTVLITVDLKYVLIFAKVGPPVWLFLKFVLTVNDSLPCYIHLKFCLLISTKSLLNLIRMAFNLEVNLNIIDMLKKLTLLIYDHSLNIYHFF